MIQVKSKAKKEDLRVIKTKRNLICALDSLLDEKSYQKITITELCLEALVSKITFYNNFKTKNDILYLLFEDKAQALSKELDDLSNNGKNCDQKVIIQDSIKIIIDFFINSSQKLQNSIINDKDKSLYLCILRFMEKTIDIFLDKHKNLFTENVEMELLKNYFSGAFTSFLYTCVQKNYDRDEEKIAKIIYSFIKGEFIKK